MSDKKPFIRLWIVSLALFAAGIVCRTVLGREDIAYSYPISAFLQFWFYLAGTAFLFAWGVVQTKTMRAAGLVCLGCAFALLTGCFLVLEHFQDHRNTYPACLK
jgi:hypothetical protein